MVDTGKCPRCKAKWTGKNRYKSFQKHWAEKHFKGKKKKNAAVTYKPPAFNTKRN